MVISTKRPAFNAFAKALREHRLKNHPDMDIKEYSLNCELSSSAMEDFENARRLPTFRAIARIVEVYPNNALELMEAYCKAQRESSQLAQKPLTLCSLHRDDISG